MPVPLRLLPLHDGVPDVDYDVDVEIMELAHALRVTLDTLPADVPYFHVPPAARPSPYFNVGVVAQAGDWDVRRSVPPDQLADALGGVPGVAMFNLQLGGCIPGTRDLSTADVLLAAARVQALDLVVSVDTMMAHLAGALGVPTWTLLQAEADWRWMEQRTDCPWYPRMRLFRQQQQGDWAHLVHCVSEALRQLVTRRRVRGDA
jgi:hypothetical protein